MSDEAAAPAEPTPDRLGEVKRRVVMGVVVVAILVGGWFLGAAVMPRWWAQRLGATVDGRLTLGSLLGIVLGVVFTVLPFVALALGWRFRRSWKRAAATLVVASLLAAPNLLTLGIVMGDGNAAHAGERILDVDGPGIRGGTLIGAVIGALLVVGIGALANSRARNRRRFKELEAERARA